MTQTLIHMKSTAAVPAVETQEPADLFGAAPSTQNVGKSPSRPKAAGGKSAAAKVKSPDAVRSEQPGSASKTSIVLKKLALARGVTVEQLMDATDWQAHSVRGFLSAVVKKKFKAKLVSKVGKDGKRR